MVFREDVCKHKTNYEQLHEKVKALEPQEYFFVNVECGKFRQKIEIPKSVFQYQQVSGSRPTGLSDWEEKVRICNETLRSK